MVIACRGLNQWTVEWVEPFCLNGTDLIAVYPHEPGDALDDFQALRGEPKAEANRCNIVEVPKSLLDEGRPVQGVQLNGKVGGVIWCQPNSILDVVWSPIRDA